MHACIGTCARALARMHMHEYARAYARVCTCIRTSMHVHMHACARFCQIFYSIRRDYVTFFFLNLMSSVAFNLTRKLEWMGRRLRYVDDAGEIRDWIAAMKAINCLIQEVHIKKCSNNWQPWNRVCRKV